MNEEDLQVRNQTYAAFVAFGRAPMPEEIGERETVLAAWRRLHDSHALVLNPATEELRMANPLSAVRTVHRVNAAGRWWYANCAWDAFGVLAALHTDGRIETSCPDCGEPIALDVVDEQPDDESLLFHCLVPAMGWWDDIVFT